MRVTTSLDLVSRCRVYARDPREPKTRRPGCIKTSPNQKSNGKNGTGRGKLPGPFLSAPSKELPNSLHTTPLPTRKDGHGSMSALLHAQCSVRMRTYVCSGCWMWAPAPVRLRRDHVQGICMGSSRLATVRVHPTARRPGFSSPEVGPDRKIVSTLSHTFIGRGAASSRSRTDDLGVLRPCRRKWFGRRRVDNNRDNRFLYDVRRGEDVAYKSCPSSSLRVGCIHLQNLSGQSCRWCHPH